MIAEPSCRQSCVRGRVAVAAAHAGDFTLDCTRTMTLEHTDALLHKSESSAMAKRRRICMLSSYLGFKICSVCCLHVRAMIQYTDDTYPYAKRPIHRACVSCIGLQRRTIHAGTTMCNCGSIDCALPPFIACQVHFSALCYAQCRCRLLLSLCKIGGLFTEQR